MGEHSHKGRQGGRRLSTVELAEDVDGSAEERRSVTAMRREAVGLHGRGGGTATMCGRRACRWVWLGWGCWGEGNLGDVWRLDWSPAWLPWEKEVGMWLYGRRCFLVKFP